MTSHRMSCGGPGYSTYAEPTSRLIPARVALQKVA